MSFGTFCSPVCSTSRLLVNDPAGKPAFDPPLQPMADQ